MESGDDIEGKKEEIEGKVKSWFPYPDAKKSSLGGSGLDLGIVWMLGRSISVLVSFLFVGMLYSFLQEVYDHFLKIKHVIFLLTSYFHNLRIALPSPFATH